MIRSLRPLRAWGVVGPALIGLLACVVFRGPETFEPARAAAPSTGGNSVSATGGTVAAAGGSVAAAGDLRSALVERSPVDLIFSPDERFVITANQTSNSLSVVDVRKSAVVAETACGEHPTALAVIPSGAGQSSEKCRVLVTCRYAGTLEVFEFAVGKLTKKSSIDVGFHPYGVAATRLGDKAYVSLSAAAKIVEIDLKTSSVTRTIEVGNWPRQMTLSKDGTRLAVSTSGDQTVSMVDLKSGKLDFQHRTIGGLNIGQLQIDRKGEFVYFPWTIYRPFSITERNIRLGWVLASRIARAQVGKNEFREAISLDVPGVAVGDTHGLALTSDEQWMVCSAGGTHELLVYKLADQKFMSVGGPGDLADPNVYRDSNKFYRVPLGGRPMNVRISRDNRRVFVTNYFSNSVQVVDLTKREVVQTVGLGGPVETSQARLGEQIFHDARRSLDQWYSCASCHYEGGVNAVPMDTRNDGTDRTFKTVTSLVNATRTAPWTWHGWQTDLHAAMRKSLHDTMLGPEPTDDDVRAMVAYLSELKPAPNPHAAAAAKSPQLLAAIERGRTVFVGTKANCASCHSGEYLTDGKIHDVGLADKKDKYDGYNTPSLIGVYRRVRLLHDGRARSLEEVLTGDHNPDKVTGNGELSKEELADLVEYLKTL
jgi:YVTN family beta-propeller protein